MYGTQATLNVLSTCLQFENDVKMYGTQAHQDFCCGCIAFENDVKMYGTQAYTLRCMLPFCLRMM